ncbi:MAG TPA: hypothetical protein VLM85_13850 [Polyangiaceae bacterium]|nr:hypothetical protein [Polyangiaceae bacterium]
MKIATRDSWETKPLPEERARIGYERSFDAAEHARLARGVVPEEMEDKWFVFYEAPWLWFHRSWTGIAIYGVRLRPEGEGSVVEEAWVNRDPAQYRETDDAHDIALLSFLVERLLLGRDVPFPIRGDVPAEKASLLLHHVVGHARSNDEDE